MRPVLAALIFFAACTTTAPKPARQNPSPMADTTRAHERLVQRTLTGTRFTVEGVLPKAVDVLAAAGEADLVIHFHGAAWLPMQVVQDSGRPLVIAAVNLGAGSGRYAQPFSDPAVFPRLLDRIRDQASFRNVYLTGFSAGYGAIREILRQQPDRVAGVLLLDGLHTSYIPDEKPLAEGGKLDTAKLQPFVDFAKSGKPFVVTHSEIFPGTFASTTETSDYLLETLAIRRTPVMKWGPLGMQQLSESRRGNFVVLGFAGNTAPDHIDHLHALGTFLKVLIP
jgi:pimeloyl-ACP methyl ester carboxylesterase